MGVSQTDGRMEGWLYTIRHNRFGLQFSRKRYFVLHENNLTSFKSVPSDHNEVCLLTFFTLSFVLWDSFLFMCYELRIDAKQHVLSIL